MTREQRLDIRLSPEERKALEMLSASEGRKLSEMARELLRSGIQSRSFFTLGLGDLLYKPQADQELSHEQ